MAQGGLEMALAERFDAITLARLLLGYDGLQVEKILREAGLDVPVLMVSALGDVDHGVMELRARGGDYLVKPFVSNELVSRLEMLLRRYRLAETAGLLLRVGDLELNLVTREARRNSLSS